MILKCLSRKSDVKKLIKYIFKEQPDFREHERLSKSRSKYYIPGIKLTEKDIHHLEAEKVDGKLLADLKAFKGTIQQFIAEKLMNKAQTPESQKPFVIKSNIRARSIEGYCREFSQNEARRLYTRSDQVDSYHVILSWAPRDAKQLTDDILKDIANEYIRLRANNCLVLGTKHVSKDHIHLHLIVSGSQLNGKSSRQSKADFQATKQKLQEYQLERYPFLHSLPRHGKGVTTEKSSEKNIKTERLSEKQALLKCLDEVYSKSTSKDHFISQLASLGHIPYFRNGRFQGIKFDGERKHRIYRYGFTEEKLQTLDIQKAKAENDLRGLREIRAGSKSIDTDRSLIYQETSDPKLQDRKRQMQQELVNEWQKFEKSTKTEPGALNDSDTVLKELREHRAKTNLSKEKTPGQRTKDTELGSRPNEIQEAREVRNDNDYNSGSESGLDEGRDDQIHESDDRSDDDTVDSNSDFLSNTDNSDTSDDTDDSDSVR